MYILTGKLKYIIIGKYCFQMVSFHNYGNLAYLNNSVSFESPFDEGFKKLIFNDVALFVAQLRCIKVSAICQA